MNVAEAHFLPILTCVQCEYAKTIDCFMLDERICDPCHAENEGFPQPDMRKQKAPLTLWITGETCDEDIDVLLADDWREDPTSGYLYKVLPRWPD